MIKNNVESIIFKTRSEAENVLDGLHDLVNEFGSVTLEEYYKLCGFINYQYEDRNYGWLSVKEAGIWRVRDGYIIQLPPTIKLKDPIHDKPGFYTAKCPGMDTDGDKKLELKFKNEDTYMGPYSIATKEVLQRAYIDAIGKQIDFFGTMKTVNSVKIDKEYITVELV